MHLKNMANMKVFFTFSLHLAIALVGGIFSVGLLRWIFLSLCSISLVLFVRTSIANPGILPRREEDYLRRIQMPEYTCIVEECEGTIIGRRIITGTAMKYEIYCNTCNIFRPKGTSHCQECNGCVYQMDHHCPWLGNCIGKRNYTSFIYLLTSNTLASIALGCIRYNYGLPSQVLRWKSILLYWTALNTVIIFVLSIFLWAYFVLLYFYGLTSRAFCRKRKALGEILPGKASKKFINVQAETEQ
ncbi:palmitoyltransferase ZDHHC9/14/18 [Nematocida sp. AWRm80]|nr:palmitoyltransferase ZDHHC9/14/18 [Nematocida sp. AWRm80]